MSLNLQNLKTLLIIVAMDIEEQALLKNITYTQKTYGTRFPIQTKQFDANGHEVIVAKSGVGLVNAALVVAMIYEHKNIDAILALGVGGALSPELNAGDLVIANKIIQHDSILSNDTENRWIAAGELTLSAPDDKQVDPLIDCDPVLTTWLEKIFAKTKTEGCVHIGTVISGSEFVANTRRKKELHDVFDNALLVEMEAGAIAQMARKLKIPFAVMKTVSDTVKPKSSISEDYKEFLRQTANNSTNLLTAIFSDN